MSVSPRLTVRSTTYLTPHCTQGLGLDATTGAALPIGAGLVGQEKAREAAGIVVELIK